MHTTQLRELVDARQAPGQDVARSEPSHIHIPRPSRARQAAAILRPAEDAVPAELALDEAA